jgi:hypothetical protein
MIKALEVSSHYKTVGAPKGANWVSDVYVVQRQCLRVTTGRPDGRFSKTRNAPESRLEPVIEASSLEPEAFEVDFEFRPEPLALLEF